jgi:hypothetical protein
VERLLSNPGYGERFGRLWLDLARYADTNGYERDGDKPLAWRYRDWVVRALNANMSYRQFVREQIAGDEVPGSDADSQIATTFLRLGTWDDEPANEATDRYDQLDDVLGTTSAVFLASTIRCARCHDHKFEPYSQKDYYRLLSVFSPLKRPQNGRADLTYPVGTAKELAAYREASEKKQAALTALARDRKALQERIRKRNLADPTKRPAFEKTPPRTSAQWALFANEAEQKEIAELTKRYKAANAMPVPAMTQAYIWYEVGPTAPQTRLLRRGNPGLVGTKVEPNFPTVLRRKEPTAPRALKTSTGRRLWFADWVASRDNPLTARVMVNRIWQWHFGRGLVATPSDFGLQGDRPTHPELLDWLACELVDSQWDMKHIHRLIAMSRAYRTSSAHDGPGAEKRLELFGRWRQRRQEAESVRDGMMAVSGQLSRIVGGPGVYPTLPKAVLATQSRPGLGWGKSTEEQASRRSIYVHAKRTLMLPELSLLDAADTNATCERRPASTTAPQALTLLNGEFTNEQARHFARRLVKEAGTEREKQVRLGFRLALARQPSEKELKRVLAFLTEQEKLVEAESPVPAKDGAIRALESFCLVLLNTSEFAYLD